MHAISRDFFQAKLDSELNTRFLLNEHGDLYLFVTQIIFFNQKITKKLFEEKLAQNS